MFTPWNKHKTLLSQGTTVRMIHGQEDDPDNEEDQPDGSIGKTRDLVAGDFFGELSLLYDCKRTCTVAATETSYGNYGLLDEASVLKLFKDYPEFEKYLKERHLRTYTDDLTRILVDTLANIDYLRDMPRDILTHLAFCMEALKLDTDQCLYHEGDSQTYPFLAIILHGCVEIATSMDKGTEFPIEYLSAGGILNPHHCIVGRKACVTVRCLKATTFYTLSVQTLSQVSQIYPKLYKALAKQNELGHHDKENFTFVLDYSLHPESYKTQLRRHLVMNIRKREREEQPAGAFAFDDNDRDLDPALKKLREEADLSRADPELQDMLRDNNSQRKKKVELANEMHTLFKQAVMEQILRKRQEIKNPTLNEVL